MRTSSMKSLTAVTTLVVTLILAVPSVDAKPARPREGATRGAITTVTQLIKRFFGISVNEKPGDPIPTETSSTSTSLPTRKSSADR